jgi:Flp pilus assembly protein TadD
MKKFISIISVAAMILVAGACNKQDQPDREQRTASGQQL